MQPGFYIGPLKIYYYGIILMSGALVGAWLAEREARRMGKNSELVWDALIWALIGGILGARLWHILTPPPSMVEQGITARFYLTHPLDALYIRQGGLGLPGAVLGGVLALYLFCRRNKLIFSEWADIAAPGLALGQAIGRWGNFVNQELYGLPSNLPWAIRIDPAFRLPGFEDIERYHPLFLYESLLNLLNVGLLLWISRRFKDKLRPGMLFLIYLIAYGSIRFCLEFIRLDASQVGGINANQVLALFVVIVSAAVFILKYRPPKQVSDAEGSKAP